MQRNLGSYGESANKGFCMPKSADTSSLCGIMKKAIYIYHEQILNEKKDWYNQENIQMVGSES